MVTCFRGVEATSCSLAMRRIIQQSPRSFYYIGLGDTLRPSRDLVAVCDGIQRSEEVFRESLNAISVKLGRDCNDLGSDVSHLWVNRSSIR